MSSITGSRAWKGERLRAIRLRFVRSLSLVRSKTQCPVPKMRLLCFSNAGNEENVYTNEGIGARRVPQLLQWCRANQIEMLAPQLPGRGLRSSEPFVKDAQVRARLLS
jgi:hypothetical protein